MAQRFGCGLPDDALRASERLQLALDAGAIVGAWVWDVPADCFIADERFARAFNLSTEICSQGLALDAVTASVHPEDLARVRQAIADALQHGGPYRCEYRVRHNDGVYRWIEANGHVEMDEKGAPQRFPGLLLDIEARRKAEAERDRLHALLHSFIAAVPGVVYAKDLQGRMLMANHGATQFIGKDPAFYIGKTDLEYLQDQAQARRIMATERRIMDSAVPEQIEEEIQHADGTAATWLSSKSPMFDGEGRVIGVICSSIDVTDRKNLEAETRQLNETLEHRVMVAVQARDTIEKALRQSQKMEAVGQLTGGVAHDFNNLLAGISGSLELMQVRLAQGRVGELHRYMGIAQDAVQRAASLTHRLLAFARRQTLTPEATHVTELIRGMEELIRRTVGPAIQIVVKPAADLWPVLIDPAQLENSLLNLCINARDAIRDAGEITIGMSNQWLHATQDAEHRVEPGPYVCIRVTDNGCGINPRVVAKVFEPFFTTKPAGAGTGLGLSMVYGFVRQSGGDITITSEVGAGTTVSLYLPRLNAKVDVDLQPEHTDDSTGVRSETILVVDDEPSVRMLVVEVLAGLGFQVLEAADSRTGLAILQSDAPIDLLVTDVGLPGGMNGRQMADAGKANREGLPVLFITGYAEHSVLDQTHGEQRTRILTKPFGLDALTAYVSALIKS